MAASANIRIWNFVSISTILEFFGLFKTNRLDLCIYLYCAVEKKSFDAFKQLTRPGFEPGTFSTKPDELPAQLGSPTDAVQIIIIFKYMNTTFSINVRI